MGTTTTTIAAATKTVAAISSSINPSAIASVIASVIASASKSPPEPSSPSAIPKAIASAITSAIVSGNAYTNDSSNGFGNACSIPSQPDLFGMGIRISLYIQWYTTVLAYIYDPTIATECTVVNYCFSVAIAIASLVHPKDIHRHEVIIVAMMLLVPPIIITVAMADNFISVIRPLRISLNPMTLRWAPAEKSNPIVPNLDPGGDGVVTLPIHSTTDWIREIVVFVATMFLLIVAAWEFFIGVKIAKKVVECDAMFIYSHYLNGRYERGLKVFSIIACILTPAMLAFLIYLRTLPGQEVTHLLELSTPGNPDPQPHWRDRVIAIEAPYSPFRSDSPLIGSIKVRNLVAVLWGIVVSFVVGQTETIIRQNELQNVMDPSQTGQLIPLTIGVCQFGLVVYRAWQSGKKAEEQPGVRNFNRDVRNSGHWAKRVVLCRPASDTR